MQNKKPFFLGVGCHKGGTTWLWDYLNSHPDCRMPDVKETHTFDSFFLPEKFGHFHQKRLDALKHRLQKHASQEKLPPDLFQLMQLVMMQQDLRLYPLFIDRLGNKPKTGRKLVGDITPSYCALRKQHFGKIKMLMDQFGFETKIIFLMRDPVDRIYSALRMFDRDKSHLGEADAQTRFNSQYADWRRKLRTDYKATIEAIEGVFTPDQIFYGFYETLFSKEEIKRLTTFLNIQYIEPNFGKKVNASPHVMQLAEDQIHMARSTYDWVYAYCAEKFGVEFIRSIWKHY